MPRRAERPSDRVIDKTVTVRFDGNVAPGLPWRFAPVQNTMTVKLGENVTAYYRATNTSDHAIKGSAAYNIWPDIAGFYFNKIQCFCFTEQELGPGQTVDMAVDFFIDPKIIEDRDGRNITTVGVSYTFYPVATPSGVADQSTGKSG
jgi:cytochrome c oxidase assembly protein subunit 11